MTSMGYADVAAQLRQQIADGTLAPGDQLPSTAQIVETYGVSTTTAARARDLLVRQGLVEARSGAGTYVRARPVHRRIARGYYHRAGATGSPFRATEADRGRRGDWIADTVTEDGVPVDIADRLHIDPDDRATRTSYVYRSDGVPVQLATSWEPYAVTGGTEVIWPEAGPHAGRGVVERMAVIGVTIDHVIEVDGARHATADEAEQLGIPVGSIVMTMERTYYAGELPVETADIVYPGESTQLVYEMPVG